MSDIWTRIDGRAGRITLQRPKALNAVTWDMIRVIAQALEDWRTDDAVDLVLIDAEGDRAFAAGGDIVDLYQTGRSGDFDFGRRFWAEEYRLNLMIAQYPKPYIALMQGFTMGGGVGISCHGSHRIVDESSQIAMPECGIGLIPDVGGSWLLARAPSNLGAFIGLTGYRMGPGDAIFAGFADTFVPRERWPDLTKALCETGDADLTSTYAASAPDGRLQGASEISEWFGLQTLPAILECLDAAGTDEARAHTKALGRQSPLSAVCGLNAIRRARTLSLKDALAQEYRYVFRCMEHGDFLEGIRAQVIDKDRAPNWRHSNINAVALDEANAMLSSLGDDELTF